MKNVVDLHAPWAPNQRAGAYWEVLDCDAEDVALILAARGNDEYYARLIAAAPEMRAEIERARNGLDDMLCRYESTGEGINIENDDQWMRDIVAQFDKLLAKTAGKA